MRESGLGVGGANNYIRTWQVFCNWLADKGYIERFRIPHIPQPKTRRLVFDSAQAIAVIRRKHKSPSVRRAQSMFALMLDTAIRFGECISILRSDIDARSGLIAVRGKTGERRVQVSIEGLRVLQRHLSSHSHERVFCTSDGGMLDHSNTLRDLRKLFDLAKVPIRMFPYST